MANDFEVGVLIGLLVGEGHFGGDGRQPQVTLRMHVKHADLFRWIERTFPGGRLYGPYHHDGRHYYQWMARGTYLKDHLLPLLRAHLSSDVDGYTRGRLEEMVTRYANQLQPARPVPGPPGGATGEATAPASGSGPGRRGQGQAADIFRRLRGQNDDGN